MKPNYVFYKNHEFKILAFSENDHIYKSLSRNQTFYEVDLLEYIEISIKKISGCILDVGANIGNHTLFFNKVMGREVFAFEPNPEARKILNKNLEQNSADVKVLSCGLGNKNAKYKIKNDKNTSNNLGAVSLGESPGGDIEVRTLNSLSKEVMLPRIAAIKIDIEGMELDMLKGAEAILKKMKPDLFVEITNEVAMHEINSYLNSLGYRQLFCNANTPVWHYRMNSEIKQLQITVLWIINKYVKTKKLINKAFLKIKKMLSIYEG